MQKLNVNVVGGSGFIGSRLVRRLAGNFRYSINIIDIVASRTFPDLVKVGDVRSIKQLMDSVTYGGVIVHLAAEHRDDVSPLSLYHDVNVEGAINICNVAREKNINVIVFTSSVAVYGFAKVGTDENGEIKPFNEYGRTKYEAERILISWQNEAPKQRSLVIVRPTVVFGERNRGNVYNLLRQIYSGKFIMIGNGLNRKSMAYVENVAAFLEFSMDFSPGVHTFNYIDKPDFTMNSLVLKVRQALGLPDKILLRLPFVIGYFIGRVFDTVAKISGKRFTISAIRVQKFCANSIYSSAIGKTGFVPPVPIEQAISQTINYEFIESHDIHDVYYSE